MKNISHIRKTLRVFTVVWLALAAPAFAGEVALGPGSVLWLEGDSTLHAYSSTATAMEVSGEWSDDLSVKDFQLAVPVEGLKSGKAGLDKNMYEALRAKEYPAIRFRIQTIEAGEGLSIAAAGTLSLAGAERKVELKAQGTRTGNGLRIRGREELRMSDFGIKPPAMLMGAVKTRDKVIVHYDIVLIVR